MDETPANAVEAVVKDAVASQRASGVIPRTNDVHKYVQGIVERMERREDDSRLRIKPAPAPMERTVTRSTEDLESEYQKRLRRRGHEPLPGSWTITREAPKPAQKSKLASLKDARSAVAASRMRTRLRLLRSKPDWAAKLKVINPLALNGQLGPEKQKHAEHLVREVVKASNAVFGPWMKGPSRKLWFT